MVPTDQIFDQTVIVFASDSWSLLAVLASSVHQHWVIQNGLATARGIARYTPSSVFETFPRPTPTDRLDHVGRKLENRRREIMAGRGIGLTGLYDLVNSRDLSGSSAEDINELRAIHIEVDAAVLDAYGWLDLSATTGSTCIGRTERFTVSPSVRVEILDRLLLENHRRAEKERTNRTSDPGGEIPREEGSLFA